jgi:hypothetical protein
VLAGRPNEPGYLDGPVEEALFNRPHGLCASAASGDIFVVDSLSYVIRRISPAGQVTTVVGAPGEWAWWTAQVGSSRPLLAGRAAP